MKRSNEPIWWSLFAAGGVVSAMLIPVHIAILGIAFPLGWVSADHFSYQRMAGLVAHPIARLYLFVLIMLPLFHAAHRLKFTLVDLGLKDLRLVLSLVCYGGAIAGTAFAACWLWRF